MSEIFLKETGKPQTKGRKNGRIGASGRLALKKFLPELRLSTENVLNKKDVFGRDAPLFLEIGFGSGTFLFENAVNAPESDFIGIEIYRPGIARLIKNLVSRDSPEKVAVTNIRIYNYDARNVLMHNLSVNSLDGAYILFPDPWPKTRHYKRRLITPEFTRILFSLLKPNGYTVVATDHKEYAAGIERAFDAAGFTKDDNEMSTIYSTKYGLKAFEENNRVRMFRFIKRQQVSRF